MTGDVLFYGDPHGEWRPLLRACQEDPPDAVVILGDCDLQYPLRMQILPVFAAGIRVRWIPGNHDVDNEAWHDRLWGDFPQGNLHAKLEQLSGLIVAGLGGVFKGRIWYPRVEQADPVVATRLDYLRKTPRGNQWRGGLPLQLRDAIFPDDVQALGRLHCDVLVTHEAPTCHRHGFVGIDDAARLCRARLVVHGHHHEGYEGVLATGARVRGLAKAEVFRLRKEGLA